jgi:predicted  nucleic acid-binding Zn-ribbon protein
MLISMRYVKCENCGTEISGKNKYLLYKVSETKGKHRNSKQKAVLRLCSKCGYNLYTYKQKKIERKTELRILYPEFNIDEKDLREFEELERRRKDDPEFYETYKEMMKEAEKRGTTYFAPNFETYMKKLDYGLIKYFYPIYRLKEFFASDKILKHQKTMDEQQKLALDESLRYLQTKIQSYADEIESIRKSNTEQLLQ